MINTARVIISGILIGFSTHFVHAEMSALDNVEFRVNRVEEAQWVGEHWAPFANAELMNTTDISFETLRQFAFRPIPFTKTQPNTRGTVFVGSLVKRQGDVYQKVSGKPFLIDIPCKPPVSLEDKKEDVLNYRNGGQKDLSIDIGIAKLELSKEEAVSVEATKIASIRPQGDLLNEVAIEKVKEALNDSPEYPDYYIVESQDIYLVSYRKYTKRTRGGSGTYSVLVVSGTDFKETEHAAKGYLTNLGMIPLSEYITQKK